MRDVLEPTPRESDLARELHGQSLRELELGLARLREELIAPFEQMREDYEALRDFRVAGDLDALIETARGVP